MSTPTISNYQAITEILQHSGMSPMVREYLVGLLGEHREMRDALKAILKESGVTRFDDDGPTGTIQTMAYAARAILAKVSA